jgi:hypothetical protein
MFCLLIFFESFPSFALSFFLSQRCSTPPLSCPQSRRHISTPISEGLETHLVLLVAPTTPRHAQPSLDPSTLELRDPEGHRRQADFVLNLSKIALDTHQRFYNARRRRSWFYVDVLMGIHICRKYVRLLQTKHHSAHAYLFCS